jgi:hypothetical protein
MSSMLTLRHGRRYRLPQEVANGCHCAIILAAKLIQLFQNQAPLTEKQLKNLYFVMKCQYFLNPGCN